VISKKEAREIAALAREDQEAAKSEEIGMLEATFNGCYDPLPKRDPDAWLDDDLDEDD
jgi:hypothetical protein